MIKQVWKLSFYVIFLLFSLSFAVGAVQVFSTYNTNISINSNETLDVHKHIILKNIHTVGIVPGRVEFKIAKMAEGSVSEIELENFKVVDRYGAEIRNEIYSSSGGTTIALDIFRPLLPGFEYSIDVYYTLSFDSSGLFFKNMQIPIKDTTSIPVQKGEFNLNIPDSYTLTYVSDSENATLLEDNRVVWDIGNTEIESVMIEYSYLPVKVGNLKGSYVFWILVNVILLIILILEIRKEISKINGSTKSNNKKLRKRK